MVCLAALWLCEAIGIELIPILQRTFTCFSKNCHISTQTWCKVCSNLTSVLLGFRLAIVFFVSPENLSNPTAVLLFKLWETKCGLEVRREPFVKIIQQC